MLFSRRRSTCTNAETTLELDSHADTCVLGRDVLIIQDFERPVEVQGFDPELGTQMFRTVSGVVAYHHPITGECFHLVIHQAIHVPHLEHHLLCPMQCRVNDVTVNDLPKFLAVDPTENKHAIIFQDVDPDDGPSRSVTLPLELKGVTSVLNVSVPTTDEFASHMCTRLEFTSEHLIWDPNDPSFGDQERAMTDYTGSIIDTAANARGRSLIIGAISTFQDGANVDDYDNLADVLEAKQIVASVDSTASHAMNGPLTQPPLPNGGVLTQLGLETRLSARRSLVCGYAYTLHSRVASQPTTT
ncbi:hypothetical protein ACHAWU_006663 [Discostella pseudostelligera]|uniref:Uncharacterized protein n=1 Tax=Discostella pseudostelligera TaxID=259834 RepID=A0ABD3M0F8_9STRA